MRRFASWLVFMLFATLGVLAQGTSSISGSVTDPSGAVVPAAAITATGKSTSTVVHATADGHGAFALTGLAPDSYTLILSRPGFRNGVVENVSVAAGQALTRNVILAVASAGATVNVYGDLPGATVQPSQESVFESDQQVRVLDRKQIEAAGPVAGSAQILALTPGANVTGYGNTGATKYTVGVNGVSQGWGGYGGYSGGGALAITLDGVPIVDPATNLWQSPTIPEQFLIQNANVTYGPGDPASRWYNNVGGMVEFTPVQPGSRPHAAISATYGSFNQKDLAGVFQTGMYRGWSGVLSAGVGDGNDFRNAPDGFQNPGKDVATFAKAIKAYQGNTFEVGAYYAHGAGYRSQVIPVVANPLITLDGTSTGQVYSQQTSGYFSTLPYASYNKYDTNEDGMLFARERFDLDSTTSVENLTWYNHIARSHYRTQDVYSLGPQQDEWNSPHTNTIGDRFVLSKHLRFNNLSAGGYYIHGLYNSRNNFYNPADGGAKRIANVGGKIRSSYFSQDDFAIFVQDELRFNSVISIVPGIRYVGFSTGYSNNSLEDFTFASGATPSTHCAATGASTSGTVKDQGANCGGLENRSGVEPSINANVRAMPWLSVYGGFSEALRGPQVGGGGGLFQSVDPASYHLSRQSYYQAGFKVHHEGAGVLATMLITGAFYHQNWANQEIDTTLANGDTVSANGTSTYKGFNASFDDDPLAHLHVFANMNVETATYSNYTTILPVNSSTPQQDFNGLHVPYVPSSTVNAGAFYEVKVSPDLRIEPMASLQFTGSQYIFNNNGVDAAGNQFPQPGNQKMASYATLNLGVKAPYKFLELNLNVQNALNSKYLIYEYTSFGGYFGTNPNGLTGQTGNVAGYNMAYPGAPVSVYGGIAAHF